MGTFTDWGLVEQMIARNGDADPEDGRRFDVMKIVAYKSPEGQQSWGVVYRCEVGMGMADRYDTPGSYILEPKVIFVRKE